MLIDCDTCAVRNIACQDCVVTFLLAPPRTGVEWDEDERRALAALADGGLLPRLQLVPGGPSVQWTAQRPAPMAPRGPAEAGSRSPRPAPRPWRGRASPRRAG